MEGHLNGLYHLELIVQVTTVDMTQFIAHTHFVPENMQVPMVTSWTASLKLFVSDWR